MQPQRLRRLWQDTTLRKASLHFPGSPMTLSDLWSTPTDAIRELEAGEPD